MEPGYALLVSIGCFTHMPLAGTVVPDRIEIRAPRPEDYRTSCFSLERFPKAWPTHRTLEIVSRYPQVSSDR